MPILLPIGQPREARLYTTILLIHSWWRWVVLLAGVALLWTAARSWRSNQLWSGDRDKLRIAFLVVLTVQFVLGAVLWLFLSPLPRAGLADIDAMWRNAVVRFYTVEHAFGMGVGLGVAFAGLVRAGWAEPAARARRIVLVQLVWLTITVVSVPWPWSVYGRPLFRL